MKATRKLFSLLLALVMILALGTTALAAENNGSIVINGAMKKDKIFDLYRVMDATVSDDGSNVAYTVSSKWEAFFESSSGSGYLTTTANDKPVMFKGNLRYFTVTEATAPSFAQAALTWCASNASLRDHSYTVTAADETAKACTISNLPLGYYLVYPRGAVNKNNESSGSIAALTTTKTSAIVNMKADYPGPDDPSKNFKKTSDGVTSRSVDVGQVLPFEIVDIVPDTTGFASYTYKVEDVMNEALTFNPNSLKLTINNANVNTTQADGNGNSLAKVALTTNARGFTLTVDMTEFQGSLVGKTIKITYTATVNEKIRTVTGAITNEAKKSSSKDPSNPQPDPDPTPDPVVITTNKIKIVKVEGDNSTKLGGAKFILKNNIDGDPNKGKFYSWDATANEVKWVDEANAEVVVTDAITGEATFDGIKVGKYQLIETEAPAGFNKLTAPQDVSVTQATNTEGKPINGTKTEQIINNAGTVLPGTGGMGTTVIYSVGTILLLGAAVLLITRKRMKNEN